VRTPAEIGELVAKIFDRLDSQFDGKAKIEDAVLIVEVVDEEDTVTLNDGTDREVPATIVLLECTSDRLVVQSGIIEFARNVMYERGDEDDDD